MRLSAIVLGFMAAFAGAASAAEPPAARVCQTGPELRSMIGQMIVVGFAGDDERSPDFQRIAEKARDGKISGVLYLQRNIVGEAQTRAMNAALQQGAKLPVLVAVDQEGGAVQRIPGGMGFPRVAPAQQIAKLKPRQAYEIYRRLARNLADWGFNLNLGPVADLNVNPDSPVIGRLGRSFSGDPDVVVQFAAAFVEAHRQQGVLTALKHFPGHGSAVEDSHLSLADVTRTSQPSELAVFEDLVRQGYADMVMTGHTYDAKLQDGVPVPATLDGRVVTDLLRKRFGHDGVVITDDLQMAAVAGRFSLQETVVKAVLAGNNLLVFGNAKSIDSEIDTKVTAILVAAAARDCRVRDAIRKSFKTVSALKRRLAVPVALDDISTRSVQGQAGTPVTPKFIQGQARDFGLSPALGG